MNNLRIHIISLTIPFPPNYGGAIDIWHKLVALNRAGIKTVLHCYKYNRPEAHELERVCEKVFYYPRSKSLKHLFSKDPFIVESRKHPKLLDNLTQDQDPILMEGIHCTGFLHHPALADRKIWIRTHNVEHHYYQSLLKAEKSLLKKLFFTTEMNKLRGYENRELKSTGIFTISRTDHNFFEKKNSNCHLITPFHGNQRITSKTGVGTYALYHGDLSIVENIMAASKLVSLSSHIPVNLIIAGRSPKERLKQLLRKHPNTTLIEAPSSEEMKTLIQEAAIILLPAKQVTGFRLKLINSLFQGKHVITSPQMVIGTGLTNLCHIARTNEEWISQIEKLAKTPFTTKMLHQREESLEPFYDNIKIKSLIDLIFPAGE